MLDGVKKQAGLLWKDLLVGIPFILGGFLLGMIICALVMKLDTTVDASVPLGTLMAAVAAAAYLVIMACGEMSVNFPLQVSMGCTRRKCFVSLCLLLLLTVPGAFLLLLLLGAAEQKLLPFLYSGMQIEMQVLPWILRIGIPVGILLILAAVLGTALVMRFGRIAFWIFWFLWMTGCMGIQPVSQWIHRNSQSNLARLVKTAAGFLRSVPVGVWILLGVLLGAVMLLISYSILRRQEVKL